MKVASVNLTSPAFQGYKQVRNNHGDYDYEFNFPYDEDKYDCYLEVYNISQDGQNLDLAMNFDEEDGNLKLKSGKNTVNLTSSYFIDDKTPFAYHYKLVNKHNPNDVKFRVDAGDVIDRRYNGDFEIYNYVSPNGSKYSRGGAMKLVIADNYNPGWQYNKAVFSNEDGYIAEDFAVLERAKKSGKHFSNKVGGSLAGVEKALEDGDFDGYSSIISLPLFTDDSLSPHGYWNKNCMQMSQSLGSINNYASLQRKLFQRGINWVSDGAFVNEGLEGIHFANVLKWGEKSPFFNWFEASGLKNGPLQLGVFGKNTGHISHKIVNSPYEYRQNADGIVDISTNVHYDPKKPTYVQIFDDRLVTEEQKRDKENLIASYDISNTDNPFDINTHDDTVINFHFEINPKTYNKNILRLNEYNRTNPEKISLNSYEGTRFVNKYSNFELEDKIESNFITWDANTDIAKLNYVYSHADTENDKNLFEEERELHDKAVKEGNLQVRDYILTSGMYWTQKTKDVLMMYVAQNLNGVDLSDSEKTYKTILNAVNNGVLPDILGKYVDEDAVKNVIESVSESNSVSPAATFSEDLKKELMNYPLDAIELGDNIAGTLASGYISKRAIHEDELGATRYDMYKLGNSHLKPEYRRAYKEVTKMYEKEMLDFATEVVNMSSAKVITSLSGNDIYRKYALPVIAQEIAKFAVIKAVKPDATVFVNKTTGEIAYDYDELKQTSLQGLGINAASPEDEALTLTEKIRTGIRKISTEDKRLLAGAITKALDNTNELSFALADMIIDRTQSGLEWRIDATKDIANIDAMRNNQDSFEQAKKEVVKFWKDFSQAVYRINPNSYTVAEITDEFDKSHVVKDLLDQTGITATANYSYLFNGIIKMFGKMFEYDKDGMEDGFENIPYKIYDTMRSGENDSARSWMTRDYLRSSNLPSLEYSYTFIGNHDKPRVLHGFGLDMGLFFCDLNDRANRDYRLRAFRLANDRHIGDVSDYELNSFDFDRVNPKAVAMGEAVRGALISQLDELKKANPSFNDNHSRIFEAVSRSVADLVKGSYMDKNFSADAFGVKPFDVVIDAVINQAKYKYDLPLSEADIKKYKDAAFRQMVDPAITKLLGTMKFLVALPGRPTLYAGDDLASTGYEEKTKNIYLQNRNYLHKEWLKEKDFVDLHYNELKEILSMRSRPELEALNNGAPTVLPMQRPHDNRPELSALFRQNTDGKMAISLFNTSGINHNPNQYYTPDTVYLDRIVLSYGKTGIDGGLKAGTEFINANNPEDKYYVRILDGEYVLEHADHSAIKIDDSTMILYHVPKSVAAKEARAKMGQNNAYIPAVEDIINTYAVNV